MALPEVLHCGNGWFEPGAPDEDDKSPFTKAELAALKSSNTFEEGSDAGDDRDPSAIEDEIEADSSGDADADADVNAGAPAARWRRGRCHRRTARRACVCARRRCSTRSR